MTLNSDKAPAVAGWWNRWVMNRRNWWLPLGVVMAIGVASMIFVGTRTYQEAPPIPDFVAADGRLVIAAETVTRGQLVFQKYALMDYGSFFGDGAARGTDYTADALHRVAVALFEAYQKGEGAGTDPALAKARAQRDLRQNRYDAATNRVLLSAERAQAFEVLVTHYQEAFRGEGPEAFQPAGYISDAAEIRDLAAFFFWGAWVCGTERPGFDYSYTHNWPYDEFAGNRPSGPIVYWSVMAVAALIAVLGAVLFLYGRYQQSSGWRAGDADGAAAAETRITGRAINAAQRATYKYFATATVLLVLQIVAGVLTVHDFLGLTQLFGFDLQQAMPITVTRGWHLQLALMWISVCWIGASIFVLSGEGREIPAGQTALINLLFGSVVLLVVGTLAGIFLGPLGYLRGQWNLWGNQGWEFVELGKAWQLLMFGIFVLWAVIVLRAVRPLWRDTDAWGLPKWMLYAVACIVLLFLSAFVARPETNFVIADFWRWAVVHMWAEAFFEVFTTVLLAWFMSMMGFVSRAAASRIIYLATLLFLGSGLLGISHNFYWNAKPVATLAIGSVFSTLQVVPLVLLTLEAWQFSRTPARALGGAAFGQREAFLFLLGVNFWNFMGAGVFGFLINLPIVNYYEHGTYLTVNHGHAALMGVYGNLALAAAIFCARYLLRPERWDARLMTRAFWAINIGLALMVAIDLLPVGLRQFGLVLDQGLWFARSQAFVQGQFFQTLTWARIVGGALFVLGGVLPLAWFFVSRLTAIKPAVVGEAPWSDPGAVAVKEANG